MTDSSLSIVRAKNALTEGEYAFLLAYAADPTTNIQETEIQAGLMLGQGRALLQSKRGRSAMAAMLRSQDERYEDIKDQLVQLICRLTSWDPKDAFDERGQLKHPRDLPNDIRVAITEFKYYPATGAIEYKFSDRLGAAGLLLKVLQEARPKEADEKAERTEWIVRGREAKTP